MNSVVAGQNLDALTVAGFGEEWDSFDQTKLSESEWSAMFASYFVIFPWDRLPADAEGFDLGCGSGRWSAGVIDRVGKLHCIDPSEKALAVARRRLSAKDNAEFHCASVDAIPLADASQDFGYSLGVLHHIPDTLAAMKDCVRKLKPGAPFLVYLYYAFDNRPAWFRLVWRASDVVRQVVWRLPFGPRKWTTTVFAALVYWPLARGARLLELAGMDVSNLPLSAYRRNSFYTLRTDALDRLGTRLEQRFTRREITAMMEASGLEDIRFSDAVPFWLAVGTKGCS